MSSLWCILGCFLEFLVSSAICSDLFFYVQPPAFRHRFPADSLRNFPCIRCRYTVLFARLLPRSFPGAQPVCSPMSSLYILRVPCVSLSIPCAAPSFPDGFLPSAFPMCPLHSTYCVHFLTRSRRVSLFFHVCSALGIAVGSFHKQLPMVEPGEKCKCPIPGIASKLYFITILPCTRE